MHQPHPPYPARIVFLFIFLVTASWVHANSPDETAAQKPNFILILSDDQAPDTVGAWGNPQIKTPNLDRLSRRGVNFMQTYNPGSWSPAVCMPSRTMLNSGLSTWRSRQVHDQNGLDKVKFWSHVMRDAGYATYMTGKWHLKVPVEDAYEHVRHERPGMPRVVPKSHPDAYNRPREGVEDTWDPADPSRGGFWQGGKHWSEVVADDAEVFLQQAAAEDRPFFMYLAFNATHDPKQAPQEYLDMYPVESMELPANYLPAYPYRNQIGARHRLRDEFLAPMPRTAYAIKKHRQEYYALASHMDTQIGRILDAVEASGEADNTYIIFTSDHGLAVGHHGFMGKQNPYEHSVRVPFFIVGPGMEAGRRIDERIYLQDVAPTVMELAGAEVPPHMDFKSLLPLIEGEQDEHYPAIYGTYTNKQRMVIEDDWKLIVYPKVPVVRLYNLAEDPLEMNDRADDPAQAPRIRRLFASLQALQAEFDDPLDLSGLAQQLLPAVEKSAVGAEKPGGLPNIVYILADDMGIGQTSTYNPDGGIPTPGLDRIAEQGMRFTDAHSAAAVCTPTRYALLTGRYNWRTHLQRWVLKSGAPTLIAAETMTVPRLLKQHGYDTAMMGKWHLGAQYELPEGTKMDRRKFWGAAPVGTKVSGGPVDRDFDVFYGFHHAGEMRTWIENNRVTENLESPERMLPRLTAASVNYIRQRGDDDPPFFLYVALNSPHTPIVPSKDWQDHTALGPFADFVAQTDHAVVAILDALDAAGLSEDTLVIFTADNGTSPNGKGFDRYVAEATEITAGLRGLKSDAWEGGHRVPFAARWPGVIEPGSTTDELICLNSLLATCAELLDYQLADNEGVDSFSILPVLRGEALDAPTHPYVIHHSGRGKFALRQGPWKLLATKGSGGWGKGGDGEPAQLYNLADDLAEKNNLIHQETAKARELLERLQQAVDAGRTTPGPAQANDAPVDIWKTKSGRPDFL